MSYLHGIALPDFCIVSSFLYKKSKQARVPTFVWLFCDDATSAKGPGCDEGTNLHLRDFAVVPLMPTRVVAHNTLLEISCCGLYVCYQRKLANSRLSSCIYICLSFSWLSNLAPTFDWLLLVV